MSEVKVTPKGISFRLYALVERAYDGELSIYCTYLTEREAVAADE